MQRFLGAAEVSSNGPLNEYNKHNWKRSEKKAEKTNIFSPFFHSSHFYRLAVSRASSVLLGDIRQLLEPPADSVPRLQVFNPLVSSSICSVTFQPSCPIQLYFPLHSNPEVWPSSIIHTPPSLPSLPFFFHFSHWRFLFRCHVTFISSEENLMFHLERCEVDRKSLDITSGS